MGNKKLIIANWKCNPASQKEAEYIFKVVKKGILDFGLRKNTEIVICPPYVFLSSIKHQVSNIKLGAQDCFYEKKGAYTGEISPLMLKDLGVKYVIIGHSERRRYLKETDEVINKKIKMALKSGLYPILCIGEEEKNSSSSIIREQLKKGLSKISFSKVANIIIAYEPIWAIGTGNACVPEEVLKINLFIKKTLTQLYNRKIAEKIKIIYGGSVNSKNAADYVKEAQMDGLLVGGASLNASEFVRIIKAVSEIHG